ncbi:MAG TPA: hypothetical protein VM573_03680 [Actinomycetota bacterium]|jgi:hypothetical protein|nr:hypothetical protein [Actinomycetota bacterium]
MALAENARTDRLEPILRSVARTVGRYNLAEGDPGSTKATLRIIRMDGVKRVVRFYWTPFQVEISGECIALFLEVPGPKPHWTECYISPGERNWVLSFFERDDGEVQLAHYADKETPEEAIEAFFGIAGWYTLTPTDTTWEDVRYVVAPELSWEGARETVAQTSQDPVLQESLKKSTIVWLRWHDADGLERTLPVWYLYDQKVGKIYVLSGERQQTIPNAERLREADVIFRQKGKNVQVGEVPAHVRVVPRGAEWDDLAERIAEKRLNIPGLPEDTARRWRDRCEILELTLRT